MKKCILIILSVCTFHKMLYATNSIQVTANPCARAYACMISDGNNERAIMFGGGDYRLPWGNLRNDAWALDFGTETWRPITPAGTPPLPRVWAAAVYDPAGNRMIVFGGSDAASTQYNDVWSLDLSPGSETWTQLTPSGIPPSPRASATAVVDQVHNRIIIFGGEAGSGGMNETWSLDLNTVTWTQLLPSGSIPSARFEHSVIYDSDAQRMIVFGGRNGVHYNDLWSLDLTLGSEAWQQQSPGGTVPNQRGRHFCVYDNINGRMIIGFGYSYDPYFAYFNDIWSLDLGTLYWNQVYTVGTSIEGRRGSCAAYDNVNDKILIFGGDQYYDYYFSETYVLILDTLAIQETPLNDRTSTSYIRMQPNPARSPIQLNTFIPVSGNIDMTVYDVSGRYVKTLIEGKTNPGNHIIQWDGKDSRGHNVSAGTYFLVLTMNGEQAVEKAIVLE